MKNLAIMLVAVVVMAAPAHAVLLWEENFDGTVGDSIVSTGNWVSTDSAILINATTVDAGNSGAEPAGGAWANAFSTVIDHTLAPDEPGFRYSWVMADPDGHSGYQALYARATSGNANSWYMQYTAGGSQNIMLNAPNGDILWEDASPPNAKVVVETSVAGGTSLWVNGDFKIHDPAIGLDHVHNIVVTMEGGYFDSMKLEIIPEPSTIGLLAIGGMLTMLRRRR
jgi:hypothetical protein